MDDSINLSPQRGNPSIYKARQHRNSKRHRLKHSTSNVCMPSEAPLDIGRESIRDNINSTVDGFECEEITSPHEDVDDKMMTLADLYYENQNIGGQSESSHLNRIPPDYEPFAAEILLATADAFDAKHYRKIPRPARPPRSQKFQTCEELLRMNGMTLKPSSPDHQLRVSPFEPSITEATEFFSEIGETELVNLCRSAEIESKAMPNVATPPANKSRSIIDAIIADFSSPGLSDSENAASPVLHIKRPPLRTYSRRALNVSRRCIATEISANVDSVNADEENHHPVDEGRISSISSLSAEEETNDEPPTDGSDTQGDSCHTATVNMMNLSGFYELPSDDSSPGSEVYQTAIQADSFGSTTFVITGKKSPIKQEASKSSDGEEFHGFFQPVSDPVAKNEEAKEKVKDEKSKEEFREFEDMFEENDFFVNFKTQDVLNEFESEKSPKSLDSEKNSQIFHKVYEGKEKVPSPMAYETVVFSEWILDNNDSHNIISSEMAAGEDIAEEANDWMEKMLCNFSDSDNDTATETKTQTRRCSAVVLAEEEDEYIESSQKVSPPLVSNGEELLPAIISRIGKLVSDLNNYKQSHVMALARFSNSEREFRGFSEMSVNDQWEKDFLKNIAPTASQDDRINDSGYIGNIRTKAALKSFSDQNKNANESSSWPTVVCDDEKPSTSKSAKLRTVVKETHFTGPMKTIGNTQKTTDEAFEIEMSEWLLEDNLDDFCQPKLESSFSKVDLGGFQTASKKPIELSDESKAKAKRILSELPELPTGDKKLESSFSKAGLGGFQTASKKPIELSDESKAKAKRILSELPELPTGDKKKKMDNARMIPDKSQGIMASIVGDLPELPNEPKTSAKIYKDQSLKKSEEIPTFVGFNTASAKSIHVSSNAKQRAAMILSKLPELPTNKKQRASNVESTITNCPEAPTVSTRSQTEVRDETPVKSPRKSSIINEENILKRKMPNDTETTIESPTIPLKMMRSLATTGSVPRSPLNRIENDQGDTSGRAEMVDTPLTQREQRFARKKRTSMLSLTKRKPNSRSSKALPPSSSSAIDEKTPIRNRLFGSITTPNTPGTPATPNLSKFFDSIQTSSTPNVSKNKADFEPIEWENSNASLEKNTSIATRANANGSRIMENSCDNLTIMENNPTAKQRIGRLRMYGKPPPVAPIQLSRSVQGNCRPSGLRRTK